MNTAKNKMDTENTKLNTLLTQVEAINTIIKTKKIKLRTHWRNLMSY